MRRSADRFECSLPAEVVVAGVRHEAALQDVSRSGVFVELPVPVTAGTELRIAIAPNGRRVAASGVVVHRLAETDARALGRKTGVGVALRAAETATDELFAITLERLIRSLRAAAPLGLHAVVADADRRVAARIACALAEAGFAVATATTGLDALAACLRRTPDIVIVDRALPVLDGFRLIDQLARVPALADVPVVIASAYGNDACEAFERGARDFITKACPLTELVARVRRLARAERPALRGSLHTVPLAALLGLFEHERTTGRLVVAGGWIDLRAGRIVDAATADAGGVAAVLALLDRDTGTFELLPANPAGELELSVTHVLLEHARLRDEDSRPIACA
jgi:DNA-binding response OmpR family regulator